MIGLQSGARRHASVLARRSSIALAAALCALAPLAAGADGGESIGVDVRLRMDPSIALRRVAPYLKHEAAAIWRPYGVRLEWADPDRVEAPGNRISLEASVERDPEQLDKTAGPFVLGHTLVEPDAPVWLPIRLSFDATARALEDRPSSPGTIAGLVLDRDVGVALGRVLAHEIGHVLLSAPFHHGAGLMRTRFRPDELAAPDRTPFQLSCIGVVRLKTRLTALTGQTLTSIDGQCIRP